MSNPLILHMDTSTDICSVALSEGDQVLALVESGPERSHATLLNRFIREAMSSSGREIGELDAVSVSKGPGSYTGLRIGVSTAKGLAYALNIALLSCGTLDSLYLSARNSKAFNRLPVEKQAGLLYCPMLDARRMEVYTALFDEKGNQVREVKAEIIDQYSFNRELDKQSILFFGNGSSKCREVIDHRNAVFLDGINPVAASMVVPVLSRFRESKFEDLAYFEPFYLKDFVATIPRKKIL